MIDFLTTHWLTILISIISTAGAFFGMRAKVMEYKKELVSHKQEAKIREEKLKQDIKDLSAPMVMNLQTLNDLQEHVENIFNDTQASRFLILVGTNGKRDLRRCSVVYEQHRTKDGISSSIGASGRYINFEFDDTYKNMLKEIEYNGPKYYITEKMPESDLKSIYKAEKVTASKVFFLRRTKIDEDNDRVWYCSIATHKEKGFMENDLINIRTQFGQIQHIIQDMK